MRNIRKQKLLHSKLSFFIYHPYHLFSVLMFGALVIWSLSKLFIQKLHARYHHQQFVAKPTLLLKFFRPILRSRHGESESEKMMMRNQRWYGGGSLWFLRIFEYHSGHAIGQSFTTSVMIGCSVLPILRWSLQYLKTLEYYQVPQRNPHWPESHKQLYDWLIIHIEKYPECSTTQDTLRCSDQSCKTDI